MGDLADEAALATLRTTFPDLEVIEVIEHDGSSMTDQNEDWGDEQAEGAPVPPPATSYPEYPKDPHNHRYTISVDGRGPMVVVRGNTAEEVNAAFQELVEANSGALIGSFWSAFKGTAQTANGTPPQAPSPQAQQAAQQFPTPPQPPAQQAPNQPYPGQPAWQQAGAPQAPTPPQAGGGGGGGQGGGRGPKERPNWPNGVYKIDVPYPQKDAFKTYREQNKEFFKGKVLWAGGGNYWVDASVVQSFAPYNPVPA